MAKVELALDAKANLGECPRWDEKEQLLYWLDINAGQIHRFNPVTGEDEHLQFDEEIGCLSLRQQGGFLLGTRTGFYAMDHWEEKKHKITDPEKGIETNRFNDGRADAKGRMIAGTVYPPKDKGGASIYSLDPVGNTTTLVEGLMTSNGVAFSPDNSRFYYTDTPSHAVMVADYDLDAGKIANARVLHQFPKGFGRPDGAAVDSEGCYWTALYEGGRVVRLSPEGEILAEIAVPALCPTMVAFGGADLKTLFITSVGNRPADELLMYPFSGALFQVQVDVAGLPEHRFAG